MEWDELDKTAFSVGDLADQGNDLEYWLSRTPQERFEAIEYMRRVLYGNDPTAATFQRVLEVIDLSQS
ncbi:MAG: hypothetical protein HYV27_03135 [Candidatus Hydrogenedentes bacterium]|nr:hypothetical protein [Candidatus Hydrogenedentota bacterium]